MMNTFSSIRFDSRIVVRMSIAGKTTKGLTANPFRLGALAYVVVGVIAALAGDAFNTFDIALIASGVSIGIGVIFIIASFVAPAVTQSKTGKLFGYLSLLAVIILGTAIGLAAYGSQMEDISERYFYGDLATFSAVGFLGLSAIVALVWPCICCSTQKQLKTRVIGLARSSPRIQVSEIASAVSLSSDTVKDLLYDAIGSGDLYGRMDGDTFIRSTAPVGAAHGGAKVLVICPYCGAKTEQGLAKCQNCGAEL